MYIPKQRFVIFCYNYYCAALTHLMSLLSIDYHDITSHITIITRAPPFLRLCMCASQIDRPHIDTHHICACGEYFE